MLTAWEIWKERNHRVFIKICRTLEQTFWAIQEEVRVWISAGNKGIERAIYTTTTADRHCDQ